MLQAIIIDDEKAAISSLKQKLISNCPDVNIAAEYNSAIDAMAALNNNMPDVIFLDIEMPKMNGFAFLEALKNKTADIVFTTAYDHYAVQAIRFSAFDYLVKPIDKIELVQTIARLKEKRALKQHQKQLDVLLQNLNGINQQSNKIAIPTLEGIYFFLVNDILALESDGSYTKMYFINRPPLLVTKSLKDFEEMMHGYKFFRIHHGYIINLEHIKQYIKGDGGYVVMLNDMKIDVSRRKKDEFLIAIDLK